MRWSGMVFGSLRWVVAASAALFFICVTRFATAQERKQTLLPPSGSHHSWFGAALAAEGDTLVVGDPEYRKQTDFCQSGYGAIAIYKRTSGIWQFSQRFLHTAGNQETKLGASVALKGNILVAGAQREDFSSSVFRTGAIFVYKRPSASQSFAQTARVFPPGSGVSDFTMISGIAQNGTFFAGAESQGKVHVWRINADGSATFAVTVTAPHGGINSLVITAGNALVLASNGDPTPFAYQLTTTNGVTTATSIDMSSVRFANSVLTGAMAGDGNTVLLAKRTSLTVGAPPYRAVQVVRFYSGGVAASEERNLPHAYDGWNSYGASIGGAPQLGIRENQGFFVGFPAASPDVPFALGFKYASGSYNYAGIVAARAFDFARSMHYAGALAFTGTDLFIGDKQLITTSPGSNPCTSPGTVGAVHAYTLRTSLPTGPGSSQELSSWLFDGDSDHGTVTATNGAYAASGSAFGYHAPNTFGEITLFRNVSGTWQQIEKYVDANSGFNGFGSALDMSSEFMVIGAPGAKNPNNGVEAGMVYVERNAGFGFGTGPWYSGIAPPSALGANSDFGDAVAIRGNRMIVGAPGANRAYVYDWTGSFWQLAATLSPSANGQADEEFGKAVAVSGSHIMVSAPYREYAGRNETGAIQFFLRNSNGNYVSAGEFPVPAAVGNEAALGRVVAMTSSYAIAGAPDGYAVSYRRPTGSSTWIQDATVLSNTTEFAFGGAVAIQGTDLLVSSMYSARVRRYTRSGGWVQVGVLDGPAGSSFGSALDLFDDGTATWASIGDLNASVGGENNGASFFLNLTQIQ